MIRDKDDNLDGRIDRFIMIVMMMKIGFESQIKQIVLRSIANDFKHFFIFTPDYSK